MNTSCAPTQGLHALVAHPWIGLGGSEATTLWTVQALVDLGGFVTLFSAAPIDLERLNRIYGTDLSPTDLRIVRSPRLPGFRNGSQCAHWQNNWFQRQCRKIAGNYDLLISGYNPIDFGRPGIQLIGDYTWDESLRRSLDPDAERLVRHRPHWVRRAYVAIGDSLRGGDSDRPLSSRGDLIVANSAWTRKILRKRFQLSSCPVIFPPVAFTSPADTESEEIRNPHEFVCLGRISPEKRIESAMSILARVREAGFPATLTIAGAPESERYGRAIREVAASHGDWIHFPGFLEANARNALLARASFGLHTRPAEAFGIAVAEMAGSGCVPFVPDAGGPAEIVDQPELRFQDEDDAVEKILAVLSRPERLADIRRHLGASMERYRPEQFMRGLESEIVKFLGRRPSSSPSVGESASARAVTA